MEAYKRFYFIFLTGAVGYCIIEILWRGYTHPSMAILGGICFVMICNINGRFNSKSRMIRAILCALAISAAELVSGLLLNVILHLNVWDYSKMPLNFMGQICPMYSLLWFFLSYAIIFVLDKTLVAFLKKSNQKT